ncbi:MAG TPA: hypothetical protein VIJ96_00220 [Acidothermaceae bacterium]
MSTTGVVRRRGAAIFAAGALVVVLAAGVGYQVGRHQAPAVVWHTGVAYVGDHQAGITISGWTYGFMTSVPRWIDAAGNTHTDSWPDCVNPPVTQKLLTFATTTVTVAGAKWRQVLVVDCRQS